MVHSACMHDRWSVVSPIAMPDLPGAWCTSAFRLQHYACTAYSLRCRPLATGHRTTRTSTSTSRPRARTASTSTQSLQCIVRIVMSSVSMLERTSERTHWRIDEQGGSRSTCERDSGGGNPKATHDQLRCSDRTVLRGPYSCTVYYIVYTAVRIHRTRTAVVKSPYSCTRSAGIVLGPTRTRTSTAYLQLCLARAVVFVADRGPRTARHSSNGYGTRLHSTLPKLIP
jgi:hypothetical protein